MNSLCVKIIRSVYILSLVSLFSFQPGRKVMAAGNQSPEYLFFYKPNNILLLPDYKDNELQLRALDRLVEQHRAGIGKSYFSIVSYVRQADAHNPAALNQASLQGSVLRAYIRVHFQLPEEKFTFQIDTMGNESNRTGVRLLPTPVPENLSVIHYALNRNAGDIARAMSLYRQIPYVGNASRKKSPESSRASSKWQRLVMENVQKTDSLSRVVRQLAQENGVRQHFIDSVRHADSVFLYKEIQEYCTTTQRPFLGVKTNLLYWAGFTPEMRWKQILPNLSLEFYLGRHWSLQFDGAYTRRLVNGSDAKRYAFSAFGVEGRYWLRGNYRFDGFYGGIYANGGEFDSTPKYTADAKGHTGEYVGGGLEVGYTQTLSDWFALEVGVRGCFRHVSYDTYHRENGFYYYESTKYKNGVRLDGVFLNMVFRLEKYRK